MVPGTIYWCQGKGDYCVGVNVGLLVLISMASVYAPADE